MSTIPPKGAGLAPFLDDATNRELLDEKAAAALLQLAPGTLSVWRSTGRYGIPFVKVGRRVRYRRADLETWLESRTRTTGATE